MSTIFNSNYGGVYSSDYEDARIIIYGIPKIFDASYTGDYNNPYPDDLYNDIGWLEIIDDVSIYIQVQSIIYTTNSKMSSACFKISGPCTFCYGVEYGVLTTHDSLNKWIKDGTQGTQALFYDVLTTTDIFPDGPDGMTSVYKNDYNQDSTDYYFYWTNSRGFLPSLTEFNIHSLLTASCKNFIKPYILDNKKGYIMATRVRSNLYNNISILILPNTKTYTNSTWNTNKTWYIKTTFSKNNTSNVVNYDTIYVTKTYYNLLYYYLLKS